MIITNYKENRRRLIETYTQCIENEKTKIEKTNKEYIANENQIETLTNEIDFLKKIYIYKYSFFFL